MKIAVINASYPIYNLATEKMKSKFTAEGHSVYFSSGADAWAQTADKVYISVIFTWHLPAAVQDVLNLKMMGVREIEIGGPAATALPDFIREKTGISPAIGLDSRFEHVSGDGYAMTFTSRGCPRGCAFCLVQHIEGRRMIEYDDFPVPVGKNPFVGDNNILATSWKHQQQVVEKLKKIRNLDINSGFDCKIFVKDPDKYWNLYSNLRHENWRFAYDQPDQRDPVKFCADYLHGKGVNYRKISVYCLVGGDGATFEECRERLQFLVNIGTSPSPMLYRPLNTTSHDYTPPGWDHRAMEYLFGYYGVPFKWRKQTWESYLTNGQRPNPAQLKLV